MNFKRIITCILTVSLATVSVSGNLCVTAVESDPIIRKDTDKISGDLLNKIENNEHESYPVVIWSECIDDSNVESLIKKEIGFNLESIESKYSAPSEELIAELNKAANGSAEENLHFLMDKHMSLTESARETERKKTDLYLSTRRDIVKELNVFQTNTLIDELNISDDKIGFISQFAPMTVCVLTTEEILKAVHNEKVLEITYYEPIEGEDCSIDLGTTTATMGIDQINSNLNLTGSGVNIGIYETCTVNPSYYSTYGIDASQVHIIGPSYNTNSTHSTYCAGIAAGNNGVAPDAEIYSSTVNNDWDTYCENSGEYTELEQFEDLINSDVDIVSVSWGSTNSINCYNNWAKYFDYIIAFEKKTVVCATGNYASNYILNPSSSFNCIAVNGFVDYYNGQAQELLNNYSYMNGNGCLKPDVIGPSLNNGTSTATPYIAGIIALMYQYKPSLSASPAVTKALLMGSCHRKCSKLLKNPIENLNETMADGITDRQGAGIPNVYNMISMVVQHSYGYGVLNSNNNYYREAKIIQPKYGATKINISMAYLQTDVSVSSPALCDNYDIKLSNPLYSNDKESNNTVSSTEMIYANMTTNNNYTLKILKNSGTMSNVSYGYAWSTNNTDFYPYSDEEGIYYLKNEKSGKYLTMNDTTLNAYQSSYSGDSNQLWIIKKDPISGNFRLMSANGNDKNLEIGNVISGSYYQATGSNTSTAMLLSLEADGTYTLKRSTPSLTYGLGIYNNSLSSGSAAAWYTYASSNKSQYWYLEAVEYKKGDVNRDGIVSSVDAELALDIYVDIATGQDISSNLDKYLADYDNNGQVSSSDATAILNHTT